MTFVLVHGASHGAWCWERMTPHLAGAAIALDLPGRGSRPAPLEAIVVDDGVDAVVETIGGMAGRKIDDPRECVVFLSEIR